ncbi:oleoyl-acyl carrier protein thioesterase 1, chloroplastic-like [Silene latifolia]|uniref:oleoyl-acyl carrier protein thioesterase 1, chloroplastic-like n=1 Tax=Silene latifolia TaxID=37657 RepID=UPI003D76ECAE
MLKGYVMIQSLSQCGFWAYPKRDIKFKYPQNISILCSKRQDLSVPVTTKETNKNGSTQITSGLADGLRFGSMSEDGLSYKECFIVRSYEVGINKTATVETIANLLQEVGCNHAQAIGFSTDGFSTTPTMRKLRLIWVIARMHIEMYRYPAWCDVIDIETWCQPEGRIGIRRDLILKDYANGEVIGRATCKWVMMSMDTRKLVRVSPQIADEYAIHCPKALRLAFPEENNKSLRKIPKLANPGHYSKFGLGPRRADLDMNQHVNNVTYIGWVRESMPQEIIDTHELRSITLDYRKECQQDDVVDSFTSAETTDEIPSISLFKGKNRVPSATRNDYDDGVQFLHLLKLSSDGSEINRGRSEWRSKPQR